jgi:sterol desaturase/sphingolipid hydroxylase (fatty acid hydroxylase superfamily)
MKIALIAFIGFALWPLLEYLIHRFLGHELRLPTLFKKEHSLHHSTGDYFAPGIKKTFAAIPVTAILFGFSYLLVGLYGAIAFSASFMTSYLMYEYFHKDFHVTAPKTKMGAILRKHHFAHHFNNPKLNHGVTTRLFDRVFGTFQEYELVKVPRKNAMIWLLDETGNVKPQYASDYKLR